MLCVRVQSLQLCPTLGDTMDCHLSASSVHGVPQARILEQVATPSSRRSSQPRDRTHGSCISCIGRGVLYHPHHLGSPGSPCDLKESWTLLGRDDHSSLHQPLLKTEGLQVQRKRTLCTQYLHSTMGVKVKTTSVNTLPRVLCLVGV